MKRYLILLAVVLLSVGAVTAQRTDTLRLLAIGNSFSVDGVEYLSRIAAADGRHIVVGNIYFPGCSMERHAANARTARAEYIFYKDIDTLRTERRKMSLQECAADEPRWDVVTMQQASHFSGLYETYRPYLDSLVGFVRATPSTARAKKLLHQTWAYAADAKHSGFAAYEGSQELMYKRITECYRRAAKELHLQGLIPSGTAVQNMRATEVGDHLTADGYHLNVLGRYTAACVWYEVLFGRSAVGNAYRPSQLSVEECHMAQRAARAAVVRQNRVTPLK